MRADSSSMSEHEPSPGSGAAKGSSPTRPPWLRALLVPLAVSLVVHGAATLSLVSLEPGRPAPRPTVLTDHTSDTLLTLQLPAADPTPEPTQLPEPEPPEPELPEPEPALPAKAEAPRPSVFEKTEAPPEPAAPPIERPAPPVQPRPAPPRAAPAPPLPGPVSFAGVQAERARRIVYLIDGSGPMASSLPFLRAELARSIAALDESQRFQVLVFREPPPGYDAAPPTPMVERYTPAGVGSLLAVNALNLSLLPAFLDSIEPLGRSTPIDGLAAALELEPDLIFLLSRSIRRSGPSTRPDLQRELARLDALNPVERTTGRRRTVIKAVQFVEDDPSGLMQAIAARHGDGPTAYRVVEARFDPEPSR